MGAWGFGARQASAREALRRRPAAPDLQRCRGAAEEPQEPFSGPSGLQPTQRASSRPSACYCPTCDPHLAHHLALFPQAKIIPESILQTCIKVSNEPPSDMSSNMRRALAAFSPDLESRLSSKAKATAFRSILFGLCFYHSLLLGRKKFGVGIGTGGRAAGLGRVVMWAGGGESAWRGCSSAITAPGKLGGRHEAGGRGGDALKARNQQSQSHALHACHPSVALRCSPAHRTQALGCPRTLTPQAPAAAWASAVATRSTWVTW